MRRNHRSVGSFIEHDAEVIQPLNGLGSFVDELIEKLGFILEMSAPERVEIMDCGAVVFLIRSLNAALSHCRIRIAQTELGSYHYVCSAVIRFDCRRSARAAAADN